MKIHYLSCHSILEYDEVSILTELGHEVFSNGAYLDPAGHISLPRPGIPNAKYYPEYAEIARRTSRTQLPNELIDPFDVIIVMHLPEILFENWEKIKHKRVIWRTIGQSVPWIEKRISELKKEGLEIVRYSPAEERLPNYAGSDALIRFYKDPAEFGGWEGKDISVLNATQSFKGRRDFVGYDPYMAITDGFPRVVLGGGNEDLGALSGGDVSYDVLKARMRDHRAYLYSGTWPASYTLSFIEAWMTGIPVIAVGQDIWNKPHGGKFPIYEVPSLIDNGVNGFVSNNIEELRGYVKSLLENKDLADRIGMAGRIKAIETFGKAAIKEQWDTYLRKGKQ